MLQKYNLYKQQFFVVFILSLFNSVLFGQSLHHSDGLTIEPNFKNTFYQLSHSLQLETRSAFLSVMGTKNATLKSFPVNLPASLSEMNKNFDHQDTYFTLGCNQQGFTGYFDPQRWQTRKIFGDGGVDVTGAPNCKLLVQKTDDALIEVANHQDSRFSVVMPASGYVSFNWRRQGGSNSPQSGLTAFVNNKQISLRSNTAGAFLQAGNILSFQIDPTTPEVYVIEKFTFVSEADEVLVRQWNAASASHLLFTEYIALSNPSISDIQFPKDCRQPRNTQPEKTGYPTFDIDGNPSTLNDVITFKESTKRLAVTWKDVFLADEQTILREWTITDYCGNNVKHQTQRIFLDDQPAALPTAKTILNHSNPAPVQDPSVPGLMLMDAPN
jgi:hypothetical protein